MNTEIITPARFRSIVELLMVAVATVDHKSITNILLSIKLQESIHFKFILEFMLFQKDEPLNKEEEIIIKIFWLLAIARITMDNKITTSSVAGAIVIIKKNKYLNVDNNAAFIYSLNPDAITKLEELRNNDKEFFINHEILHMESFENFLMVCYKSRQ